MPKTTKWTTVCSDMAREDSQLLMEDIKVFIIVKSQLVPCVCALTKPHKMRYQLLRCSPETCKAAAPYNACLWKGKVFTCQGLSRVTIMEAGAHETLVKEPQKVKLTPRLKDYGREMVTQGLKPSQIHNGLTESELPTLRQVQWFVSSYSKKNLHRNDDYAEILSQIDQLAYGPTVSDTNPFSFGWKRDDRGKPDSFVFRMDVTFKLNQVGYPVIGFCFSVEWHQLVVKSVMADAEAAQQNAVVRVFGADCEFVYLMCFYHLLAKMVWFRGYFERTFNRLIKRDYTLRTKHKIGTLIQLLADCCAHQSVTPRIFKESPESPEATQQLNARVKDFRRRDLLVDMTPIRSSIEFLLVFPNPDVVAWLRACLPPGAQAQS
ncbi:hypothetical protein F444_05216 [Phytophthora nicotianae P1976]|uniref:MULE transposase domain-containing protein n=1 Tax=Phytophthora nicotianae P1976 TaxID=1317066 RepID=A0A081AMV5_PHYNI|nr:hypothetical protein F444_05216 [Phytophthora nicotianae P1976]